MRIASPDDYWAPHPGQPDIPDEPEPLPPVKHPPNRGGDLKPDPPPKDERKPGSGRIPGINVNEEGDRS
jgi:hypothetical protein